MLVASTLNKVDLTVQVRKCEHWTNKILVSLVISLSGCHDALQSQRNVSTKLFSKIHVKER